MNPGATLANWRTQPANHWAFHHVRELIPTADIPNDRHGVRELEAGTLDFSPLQIEPDSGEPLTLEAFLRETDTDGFIVLHRGRILFERYANGMSAETPHILMSVSKSMLGLLFGFLKIDTERAVTDFVPEMKETAYRGATLRQLLDMRAGVAFNEDYLATSGPIVEYRKATGWNPLAAGERPSSLHAFYPTLTRSDGPHGGRLHYTSPNSDLLGWVIENATGRRYAELLSEHLWKPAGAEYPAYITVDRLGAPRAAGGVCTTLRDLARVGLFMTERPLPWIDDLERSGDASAWREGDLAPYFGGLPLAYRSLWYALEGEAPLLFGYGIHGQFLLVDRRNALVAAKFSSQAAPMDAARIGLMLRAVSEIRKLLA
jgi:CubicO group peptidase (beta-lactamase class C family)